MNKQQNLILWIGLGLIMVYLLTDITVRNTLFGRGVKTVSSNIQPGLTAADFTGLPSSVGNTQSNTGNSGSAKVAGTQLV